MRLVREQTIVDDIEPLWGDEARDRGLVEQIARRLLGGEEVATLAGALRALPSIAAGAAGEAQAEQLIERAEGLARRCRELASAAEGRCRCLVSSFNLACAR